MEPMTQFIRFLLLLSTAKLLPSFVVERIRKLFPQVEIQREDGAYRCGLPAAALALAERELGPLADDPQTLFMLTQLARSAGRPDVAEHYVRRLLRMALERDPRSAGVIPSTKGSL